MGGFAELVLNRACAHLQFTRAQSKILAIELIVAAEKWK